MQPYRYITEDEVLEQFIGLPQKKRESLLLAFRALADRSPGEGEFVYRDENGRMIYRWDWKRWRIWFWDDGPVNEVRIVEVEWTR